VGQAPTPGEKLAQGFPHKLGAMRQRGGAAKEGAGRVGTRVLAIGQSCSLLATTMNPPVGSLPGLPSNPRPCRLWDWAENA